MMSTFRRRKVSISDSGKRKKRKKYCTNDELKIATDEISRQFQIMQERFLQEIEIRVQSAKDTSSTHLQNSYTSEQQGQLDTDDVSSHEMTDFSQCTPGKKFIKD